MVVAHAVVAGCLPDAPMRVCRATSTLERSRAECASRRRAAIPSPSNEPPRGNTALCVLLKRRTRVPRGDLLV
eukprot:scaffold508_cov554-Prasinococcus_capsulatus_cf.AAC.12